MDIPNAPRKLAVDNANLSGSTFQNADLSASTFRDVNLADASFEDINLRRARFSNINLSGVQFEDCNVSGARLNGVSLDDALNALKDSHPPIVWEAAGVLIRPFREADSPEVIELWMACFAYTAPHNDPQTAIRQKLAVDRNLFGVAEIEGRVVGTLLGGYDGHRGWIYSLAVAPAHRRRGIASQLVKWAERGLADRGCMKVNLQLMATNVATTAFYQKLGYQVEERISMGKVL